MGSLDLLQTLGRQSSHLLRLRRSLNLISTTSSSHLIYNDKLGALLLKDLLGKELKVGLYIVSSARQSRSTLLRSTYAIHSLLQHVRLRRILGLIKFNLTLIKKMLVQKSWTYPIYALHQSISLVNQLRKPVDLGNAAYTSRKLRHHRNFETYSINLEQR